MNLSELAKGWGDAVDAYNERFGVSPEPEKKKRRRKTGGKVLGWPAGISRNAYKAWAAEKRAKGDTEGVNPHAMKAELDAALKA